MGLKSYTVKTKTKNDFAKLELATFAMCDLLDVDICFSIVGGITGHATVCINCSDNTAEKFLAVMTNAKLTTRRLETWSTVDVGIYSKIKNVYYYKTVEEFWDDLK